MRRQMAAQIFWDLYLPVGQRWQQINAETCYCNAVCRRNKLCSVPGQSGQLTWTPLDSDSLVWEFRPNSSFHHSRKYLRYSHIIRLYIYMYVYTYVYIYIHIYVYVYVYVYVYIYILCILYVYYMYIICILYVYINMFFYVVYRPYLTRQVSLGPLATCRLAGNEGLLGRMSLWLHGSCHVQHMGKMGLIRLIGDISNWFCCEARVPDFWPMP